MTAPVLLGEPVPESAALVACCRAAREPSAENIEAARVALAALPTGLQAVVKRLAAGTANFRPTPDRLGVDHPTQFNNNRRKP